MNFKITQIEYDKFAAKAKWQQTPAGLIKKAFRLRLRHKEVCDLLIAQGITLTKQDEAYYIRHSNPQWVKEWKNKCSEGHVQEWANLSTDEREKRGKAYVQNLFNYRDSLSEEENVALGRKISQSKMASKAAMSKEELAARYKRMSDGWNKSGPEARELRRLRISESCWKKLTPEEKVEKCRKVSAHLKSKYHYVSDDGIHFDSRWEELLYRALVNWDIRFFFTHTSNDKNLLKLSHPLKATWKPDFILPDFDVILEVKGFHEAAYFFKERVLPAFKESKYAKKYSLYIINFPLNPTHLKFEDVIKDSICCHKLSSNKKWNKLAAICSMTSIKDAWLRSDMQKNKPCEFGGYL